MAMIALAVAATFGSVMGVKSKVEERVQALGGFHVDVTAASTISTRGATSGDMFLTAKGCTPIATVSCLDKDFRLINEHA